MHVAVILEHVSSDKRAGKKPALTYKKQRNGPVQYSLENKLLNFWGSPAVINKAASLFNSAEKPAVAKSFHPIMTFNMA